MPASNDDILQQITKLFADLSIMKKDLDDIKGTSQSNARALRGSNGEPGVISRLDSLEKSDRTCPIMRVVADLYGSPLGKEEAKPGLMERMRNIEEWVSSIKRFTWALYVAIGIGIIDMVLEFIKLKVITP